MADIVLSMIWDVTELAEKNGMMDKKSKFDNFLRTKIGKRKQGEVHSMSSDILVENF